MPFLPPRGLKAAMKAGELKIGMFIGTSSIQVAEIAMFSGVDFLFLDLEHGTVTERSSVGEFIRAASAADTPVIVRVPANNPEDIATVLDAGAVGICVPHVRTREDAERAVAHARYAPTGVRAMSQLVRAAQYSGAGWEEYWKTANDEVIVMVIVEDRVGISNLDEISTVPGLDVLWIGTGDLGQDLGAPLKPDHPETVAATTRGNELAAANGLISFMALGQSPAVDRQTRHAALTGMRERGYGMLAWVDTFAIVAAFAELVAAKPSQA